LQSRYQDGGTDLAAFRNIPYVLGASLCVQGEEPLNRLKFELKARKPKTMKRIIAAALFAATPALALGLGAVPAAAQDAAGDKVNMVIIYGDEECPVSTDDVINVCARKGEGERYRIPDNLRSSSNPDNTAWAKRAESFEMVGAFGAFSCSPTGGGGFTGCTQQMIDAAYGEKSEASGLRFAQLIAAERAERLSTIDEEAAETQARVEVLERAYLEKLERERDGLASGEETEVLPVVSVPALTADDE
jgi:hypothetical protein